jgi:hypothetical protein
MAQIAVAPLFMKDVLISVGTNSYEKHVSAVTFTPSSSAVTYKGLNPTATYTETTAPTWAVDIAYVQDWATTNSLSAYLFANQGTSILMTFKPKSASGPSFTATVIIATGAIGGQVDSFATTTVSLPVQGQPTLVPGV